LVHRFVNAFIWIPYMITRSGSYIMRSEDSNESEKCTMNDDRPEQLH